MKWNDGIVGSKVNHQESDVSRTFKDLGVWEVQKEATWSENKQVYVRETCTHGFVVESGFTINEGEPYHDQTDLEARYEVNVEQKMLRDQKERKGVLVWSKG